MQSLPCLLLVVVLQTLPNHYYYHPSPNKAGSFVTYKSTRFHQHIEIPTWQPCLKSLKKLFEFWYRGCNSDWSKSITYWSRNLMQNQYFQRITIPVTNTNLLESIWQQLSACTDYRDWSYTNSSSRSAVANGESYWFVWGSFWATPSL